MVTYTRAGGTSEGMESSASAARAGPPLRVLRDRRACPSAGPRPRSAGRPAAAGPGPREEAEAPVPAGRPVAAAVARTRPAIGPARGPRHAETEAQQQKARSDPVPSDVPHGSISQVLRSRAVPAAGRCGSVRAGAGREVGSDGRQGSGKAGPDVIRPGRRRKGSKLGRSLAFPSSGTNDPVEQGRLGQSRFRIAQVRRELDCAEIVPLYRGGRQ